MLLSSIANCVFHQNSNQLLNGCMDIHAIRRTNLLLLKAKHRTFKNLGDLTGTDPSVLSQINIGHRDMGGEIARRIEEKLGLGHGWMDTLHPSEPEAAYNVTTTAKVLHDWPVYSWVSAGLRTEAVEAYDRGEVETVTFESELTNSDIALQVKGDSMIRPDGTGFPDGCHIAVRRHRKPKNKDFVVVRFSNTDEATFKQFIVDGPVKLLKALNPAYPTQILAPDAVIVGVVCEKRISEKF